MNDLERRVSATLTERAERTRPAEALHEGAVRGARRIRRRRRLLGAASAGLTAVAALVLGVTGAGPAPTTLPPETVATGGAVGTDPALLHFDVDLTRIPARLRDRVTATEWVSGRGYEKVTGFGRDDDMVFTIALTTDPDRARDWLVDLGAGQTRAERWDEDGTIGVAGAQRDDADLLPAVVSAVRLGRTQRCVMPLHLSELPPGAWWSECQTRLRYGGRAGDPVWIFSGLTLHRADDKVVFIWADGRPLPYPSFQPDRTIAGYPAQWRSGRGQFQNGLWVPAFGPYQLYVTDYETQPADWFTPEVAQWYAARLTPSADLNDPSSWPGRAVG
ncbi:hypothetical protein [Dactylosporangium sp. CA-139066]|uniref:hypothetical protein n=1 Tax=Dactylosporangium sp. CA-139066 TaxID=3239930 RepID=UPI003D90876D